MEIIYTFEVDARLAFDITAANKEEAVKKAKAALEAFERRMDDGAVEAFAALDYGYVTLLQVPEKKQIVSKYFTEDEAEVEAEARREAAMEAGMGLGINAYNDAMGFGSEPTEPEEEELARRLTLKDALRRLQTTAESEHIAAIKVVTVDDVLSHLGVEDTPENREAVHSSWEAKHFGDLTEEDWEWWNGIKGLTRE